MGEMPQKPPLLAAENMSRLVSYDGGRQYRQLHQALAERGYKVLEAARLMGAPEACMLPGGYNDVYGAMGYAVAVTVAEYLAKHLPD